MQDLGLDKQTIYRRGDKGPAKLVRDPAADIKVYRTKAYEQFEFAAENRPIYQSHLANLRRSIEENGFLPECAIHVIRNDDDRLVITDGQHRFTACKELGIEVLYIIKEDRLGASKAIRVVNAYAKAWSDVDYLKHFVSLGYPAYIKLRDFMTEFHLPINAALAVLAGGIAGVKNLRIAYRTGDIVIGDRQVDDAARTMSKVNDIRNRHERVKLLYSDRPFLNALITIVKSQHYDHKRMLTGIDKGGAYLTKCTNTLHYLTMLTEIFNKGRREETRILFTKKGSKIAGPRA